MLLFTLILRLCRVDDDLFIVISMLPHAAGGQLVNLTDAEGRKNHVLGIGGEQGGALREAPFQVARVLTMNPEQGHVTH